MDNFGNTALHKYCECQFNSNIQSLKYLIDQKFDINKKNNKGNTPFFELRYHTINKTYISTLIENGANVNILFNEGISAIHVLCIYEKLDMMKELMKYKMYININIPDINGDTPLLTYCRIINNKSCHSKYSIFECLIENGANLNIADKDGKTPLMVLCNGCRFMYFIEYIINCGADIYTKDNESDTALTISQRKNHLVYLYLIENGALWKFCNYSKKN